MADNNRNWGNQYNQRNDDDWQQSSSSNRNRRDDYNQSYQNSNYNDQRAQRNSWESSGFDDMDDNSSRRSNVGSSHDRYSNMSNNPYESRNRGYQQNQGGYQHSNWGNQQQGQQGNYGNQRRGNEWNRPEDQWGSAGMYGGDFGRDDDNRNDWRSKMSNSGNRYGSSNWQDSNYGGYSPGYNEQNRNSGNRYRPDYDRRDNDRNWWDRTKDKVSSWFGDDDDDRNRNRQYSGGHRGKGPKDYQRSSDRIKEDVCDRLSDDDALDATHIQVHVQGNEVVLSGTVNDRYQKRYAEDLVESISGVRHVENRIRVGTSNDLTSHEYTGNTSNVGGIGNESGTTNEIIRNTGNAKK